VEKGYSIERAKQEHVVSLPSIERAAVEVFPENMISEKVRDHVTSLEQFAEAQTEKRLWVALAPDKHPVGFAMASVDGQSAMLAEIDVHPEHQQKGLGRALVQAVIMWARSEGFARLSLTTFSSVPWNAPFYEKMGFRRLARSELTAELSAALNNEEQLGLKERVAMQIVFSPSAGD
jgi:GNAT superfamily N-acetyltransferase